LDDDTPKETFSDIHSASLLRKNRYSSRMASPITSKILISQAERLGGIALNNPQALHALTHDMIDGLDHILQEWNHNSNEKQQQGSSSAVQAILIKAAPGAKRPAFCAGGDVKSLYNAGKQQPHQQQQEDADDILKKPESYFYSEYQVNHAVATCPLPIISLWDGIVMGGGAGISVHGTYRVATEHSLLAMPECTIGLFPDVGSMWWMTRLLQRPVAHWMALTGARLQPGDLLYTGLATHYVPSHQLEQLEKALAEATTIATSENGGNSIAQVLESFHEEVLMDDCFLAIHQSVIDETFGNVDSVEAIISNLENEGSEFSQSMLQTLAKQSPTSLKLTLEGLHRAAALSSIGEDLQMEYRMAKACVRPGADFYEGVRAALVDKDQQPKWNPATLEEVTNDAIEQFFAPLPAEEEWVIPTISNPSSTSRL
jgi:enoyl-CoA hydratase/carnithine racemase